MNDSKNMEKTIPILDLDAQLAPLKSEILDAVERCLDHKGFCLGPEVERFEKDFAAYHEAAHAVGVNSGTSAMHLAACLLELGPGDEVITTPYTFVATSWAICYTGAKPVFVDIEESTMNIDAAKLEAARTAKTKAVFPVHLYGQPCDLEGVSAFCEKHGLPFVEDAAQAHGARYKGRRVGTFGAVSGFSFYPGKNLGACGEGGALLTNDDALAERAKALRNHGSKERYYHDEVGYNYRMEGIQAAVLGIKLKKLDGWSASRRRIASRYHELLRDTPLLLPAEAEGVECVYHLFVVRHRERDALSQFLRERGVECGMHYPVALHMQKCFSELGYREGDFPVVEKAARECLSLPIYPDMVDEQVCRVAELIHEFFKDERKV